MQVALIDYRAGNLTSVRKALAFLHVDVQTPQEPAGLADARAVIVPGVGHFQATSALDDEWRDAILRGVDAGRPLLGICLGMQWLFEGSAEAPDLAGLGLMKGTCFFLHDGNSEDSALEPPRSARAAGAAPGTIKVPHVGWNSLDLTRCSWLLDEVEEGAQVYFTHSFAPPVTPDCAAATTHGVTFASVVEHEQICGVQFHPEKSGDVGLIILRNFLSRASRR